MKIVFTGGGTGGHFYPIIAVAEAVRKIARERKLLTPELYYIAPHPYDKRALFEHDIVFKASPAGKIRTYMSVLNFFDFFKTGWGIIQATVQLFFIYPDVVFSKGGYASFPTVFAARILRIPVVIHDSDAVPGRVNLWAGKFARSIAVSYPEAIQFFPTGRVAHTGNPVRKELLTLVREGAFEFLKLDPNTPTLFIIGGSQGAQRINNVVLGALKNLVLSYQIIHQTGKKHLKEMEITSRVVLEGSKYAHRYKTFDHLNPLALRMSAGASDLVISRAGSGAIFEIAAWGKPAIIIPIPESVSRDQHRNAFAYTRSGAAVVLEESNVTPNLLISEIDRIMNNKALREEMSKKAEAFARPEAANAIARELLAIAVEHESK
tara:strand:+ start:72733 stop:73866 length:1134 start_codon:yes stop_codon:yes gene_type:complete